MKQHLKLYLLTLLKVTFFAPLVVTSHLFRVVHGLYLLAALSLMGMKTETDDLLSELMSIEV